MQCSMRKVVGMRNAVFVVCVFMLLSGCRSAEERRASVIETVDTLSNSASGAIKTARSGVQGAVDAGKTVTEGAKAITEEVTDRVDKVNRGRDLIKEGLGVE